MTARIFLLFLALFSTVVPGLTQEMPMYSLREAIDLALQNNSQVLIAQKEIESAKGRRLQATSLEHPELTFAWEGIRSGEPISRADERTISLEQALAFPYKLFLRKGISNKEINIATNNSERTKRLIAAEVKQAYFRVSYQSNLVETLESTLGLLREFQDATLFKYQAGDLPYLEVVRAKVEIAETQNEIIEAKKELVSFKSEFNLLLGNEGFEEFELEDPLSYVPFEKSKEQVVQDLTQKNRTLKIAQLSRERENKSLRLAQSGFIPDLHLSGGFLSESGGKYAPSFEIGFTLPLWWWNPKGEIQENRANLEIAKIRLTASERIIRGEIERAYESVRASQEQVLLFEGTLLPEIEEELKSGINSYQNNQIDALNLLDIYRTYKKSQIEYYRTLYNYLTSLTDLEVAGEKIQ